MLYFYIMFPAPTFIFNNKRVPLDRMRLNLSNVIGVDDIDGIEGDGVDGVDDVSDIDVDEKEYVRNFINKMIKNKILYENLKPEITNTALVNYIIYEIKKKAVTFYSKYEMQLNSLVNSAVKDYLVHTVKGNMTRLSWK